MASRRRVCAALLALAAWVSDGAATGRPSRARPVQPPSASRAPARAAALPRPPRARGPADAARALAFGAALFWGAHFPASELEAFAQAEPAQQAAPALQPLEEAWDYADRYFLDRSFGGHDWRDVRARLVEAAPPGLSDDEVDRRAKEMYALLGDRYSRALSRGEADALAKYDVTGVNVNVMRRPSDGALIVSSVPPRGSESERSGVRFGDTVLAINGVSMEGKTPFDALEVIQSKPDGTVSFELRHATADGAPSGGGAGGGGPADGAGAREYAVSLKRAFVASSPVLSRVVRVGSGSSSLRVGYVKLQEFNSVGKRQVGAALQAMAQQGVDGYVLDLRGNRGGVLEGALGIGGFFLGRGAPVVNVVDGFGARTVYAASEDRLVPAGAPVAVLVDSSSASASEVLAGALRDSCRAEVIGEGTYGKGVIQGVFGLRNGGAVVLTLAKYQSPSGAEINGVGVAPTLRTRLASSVLPPLLDGDVGFAIRAAADARARAAEAYCPSAAASSGAGPAAALQVG